MKLSEKTVFCLFHKHFYDNEYAYYSVIDMDKDRVILLIKILTNITLDISLNNNMSGEKYDENIFKFFMSGIAVRNCMKYYDKDKVNITKYDSLNNFDHYIDDSEYIIVEKNEQEGYKVTLSPKVLDIQSSLLKIVMLVLMSNKKTSDSVNEEDLIATACAELILNIEKLSSTTDYFKLVGDIFKEAREKIAKKD